MPRKLAFEPMYVGGVRDIMKSGVGTLDHGHAMMTVGQC
jgi:hypothetical protein